MFRRIPAAFFFTLGLPLVVLVLVNALFGDGTVGPPGERWPVRQFYTGGLAAFTAVTATYTNLANMVPLRREEGVLKRWRSTPLPRWVYIAGFVVYAVAVAVIGALVMLSVGVVAYDLHVDVAKLPAALVTFLIGVTAFSALGLAVASAVPSAEAAPAVANATILPLAFISDVFVVTDDAPRWVEVVGGIFPLRPFVQAFQGCFNPVAEGSGFDAPKLAVVAAWGVAGAVIALKAFRWEPSPGRAGARARRRGRRPAAARP
jgi:ABC-2 type transport system permease protein